MKTNFSFWHHGRARLAQRAGGGRFNGRLGETLGDGRLGEPSLPSSTSGVALVIVLAMLVLITALVVAFFNSVTTEYSSAKAYSTGESSKQLADSAVNIVMAQIKEATAGFVKDSSGNPITTQRLAWASQPGMLRTWNDSGNPYKFYKLYSSGTMVVDLSSGGTFDPAQDQVDLANGAWKNQPAIYTDLNSPVVVQEASGSNTIVSPIIDANNLTGSGTMTYSGMAIEGFSVTAPPSSVYNNSSPISPTNNPVPMPVKWIYLLKNGALVTPTLNGSTVQFPTTGTLAPSTANPIVGRIAFWADDETCKVNVNTASEGIYWDQPRGSTIYERGDNFKSGNNQGYNPPTLAMQPNHVFGFGWALPFTNEFQRTPGHPAMVCMSTVFGSQLPRPDVIDGTNYSQVQKYYGTNSASSWPAPRTLDGGSKGGTVIAGLAPTSGGQVTGTSMPIGNSRLYASADEFLFTPGRSAVTGTIPATSVRAARFFITANSRAPEVTLWNTPRMSVWPLFSGTTLRNAKDALLGFCSTTGVGNNSYPYYFTRFTPYSSTAPGSGQSSTTDINLPRNTQLYTYLNNLLLLPVPGIGGAVGGNLNQHSQTLTEIFDYIRVFVNGWQTNLSPSYSYLPTLYSQGAASAVPMDNAVTNTHGFGRTATLKDITMIFYAADIQRDLALCSAAPAPAVPPHSPFPTDPLNSGTGASPYPQPGIDPNLPLVTGTVNGIDQTLVTGSNTRARIPYTTKIGLALIPTPYLVSPGAPAVDPSVRYRISGLTSIQANGSAFFSANTATIGFQKNLQRTAFNFIYGMAPNGAGPRDATVDDSSSGGFAGFKQMIGQTPVTITPAAYDPVKGCPGTFHFNGGTLTVDVLDGLTGNTVIQTININIPAGDFPVPTLRKAQTQTQSGSPYYDAQWFDPGTDPTKPLFYTGMGYTGSSGTTIINPMVFSQRFNNFGPFNWSTQTPTDLNLFIKTGYIKRGDTVRSVQINTTTFPYGDMRLVAALKNVPASFFGARPGTGQYDNAASSSTVPQAHSLAINAGEWNLAGYATSPFTPAQRPPDANPVVASTYEPGATVGSLYPGITYSASSWPDGNTSGPPSHAPFGLSGAYMNGSSIPGDWDNGVGSTGDGPFINKTDEAARSNTNNWDHPDACYFPDDWATQTDDGATYSPSRQIASAVQFGSLPSRIDPSNPTGSTPWQTLLFCPNPAAGSAHTGFGVGTGTGPGATPPYTTAPDHVWLDLFWMPVVEPYAISEPFSTAGKVNLNQQLMPFGGYIERTTALRAVLRPLQIAAIPTAATTLSNRSTSGLYKVSWNQSPSQYGKPSSWGVEGTNWDLRYAVNLDATIAGFKARYGSGSDVFHSASEVCNVFMVPKAKPGSIYNSAVTAPQAATNATYNIANLQSWWAGTGSGVSNTGFLATGINTREAPYNHIYPLVTTKSNTYQIHYRVQLLKKLTNSDQTKWVEGNDLVLSEYRGSSILERYIDPNNPLLPDFATLSLSSTSAVIDNYYKFRVVSTKAFTP
ncbi:MAG: Verru_Chthon cassette protein A [Verrucomicrobiota bacterium]